MNQSIFPIPVCYFIVIFRQCTNIFAVRVNSKNTIKIFYSLPEFVFPCYLIAAYIDSIFCIFRNFRKVYDWIGINIAISHVKDNGISTGIYVRIKAFDC